MYSINSSDAASYGSPTPSSVRTNYIDYNDYSLYFGKKSLQPYIFVRMKADVVFARNFANLWKVSLVTQIPQIQQIQETRFSVLHPFVDPLQIQPC